VLVDRCSPSSGVLRQYGLSLIRLTTDDEVEMLEGADVADRTPLERRDPVAARRDVDPNVIGYLIALGGAGLGIIALWLPLWDPESLRRAHNHLDELRESTAAATLFDNRLLLESVPGLLFLGIAISCAVSVFVAYRGRRTAMEMAMTEVPVIAGIVAIVVAILAGLAADLMAPTQFVMETGALGPGPGVYAELVAGLLMLVGGLLIRRSSRIQTLVVAGAAGALVASSTWLLVGLSEPLSPYAGMHVSGAPGDTPRGYSAYIAGYCRSLGVERAAIRFGVAPTAEDAARAVAGQRPRPWWDAAYEGCLRGFRDGE
jgi:hypothetical protein